MAVIRIDNFVGEAPSVSPRAMGATFAQRNQNLLLTTTEFRPLATAAAVASTANGTQTLYRFARDAAGNFNANPATGWISATDRRSYVKGQINDERTERTYLTFDNGSARPRVIDAAGQDRLLGVPRPAKPVLNANVVDELTREEANNFLFGEANAQVQTAISANLLDRTEPNARRSGATIFAGPASTHGLVFGGTTAGFNPWDLVAQVPAAAAQARGLDAARIGAVDASGTVSIPIPSLPAVFRVNDVALSNALRLIQLPAGSGDRSGSQLLSDAQIADTVAWVNEQLNPNRFAKTQRDRLDSLVQEFVRLVNGGGVTAPTPPTKPIQPSTPQWTWTNSENSEQVETPEWVAYRTALNNYNTALDQYNRDLANFQQGSASVNDRIAAIQQECIRLVQEIERLSLSAWESLTGGSSVSDLIQNNGGLSLIGETVDRVVQTRFYIVTMVTDWGEESMASPVSDLVEIDQNDTVTVNRPALLSGEAFAARNIQRWRIYRSNTGSESSAFQFVDEVPIAQTQYLDQKKGEELGEVCPSMAWDEPPYRMDAQFDGFPKPVVGTNPFLRGLIGMPNGIMAGFFDNTIAFCEPYVPYAWPVEYQITTEFPIVGLGVFGQTLFVGTTANPYFISGVDSANMSAQKLDSNQACASARSIVGVQGGVLYASPDGLCLADGSGVQLVSRQLFTREDWQALNPASTFAVEHDGVYYLWYSGQGGGCLTFDLGARKLGRIEQPATAAFVDLTTDSLFVANGTLIQNVLAGSPRVATWRSGRMVMEKQAALAWLKVYGDQTVDNPATVTWTADGQQRYQVVITNTEPVRLPPGRWLEHDVQVSSQARITRVAMASSVAELQAL